MQDLVKQYGRLFEMEGVKLTFAEDALSAISKKAISRKTGARGLRSILESILLETMYELPSREDITEVVITEEVIAQREQPILLLSKQKQAS